MKVSWRNPWRPKCFHLRKRESLSLLKEQRYEGKKKKKAGEKLQRNGTDRKEKKLKIFGKLSRLEVADG